MAVDTMAAEADLSLEDLQPIQQSLVKYVLAWQESEEDGIAEAEVIVVMTRAEGFLLALPLDFVAEDTLALGAIFDERPLGMSKVVTVPAVMQEAGSISPLGVQMSVVLVDCASSLVVSLRPYVAPEEAIARFLEDDPDAFPDPARVTEEALRWMGEATDFPAAALYTPEVTAESEVELVPENPSIMRPKAKVRADGATPTAKPKAKKPTTANLAASMETMSSAIQELIARQHAIEEQLRAPPNPTTAALQRPLSEQVAPREVKIADVAPASRMADLAMTSMAQPLELMELEKDKPPRRRGFHCTGDDGPVGCPHHTCHPSSIQPRRPNVGVDGIILDQHQRSGRKGEAPSGVGLPERPLLRECDEGYESTDVPNNALQYDLQGDDGSGGVRHPLHGALRRVWKAKRLGHHPVPGDVDNGLPSDGELGGRQGFPGPSCSDVGAGHFGWRIFGVGAAPDADRRPPECDLHKSHFPDLQSESLLATGRPKMGHNSFGLHPRTRHYNHKEVGANFSKRINFAQWRRRHDPAWRRGPPTKAERKGKRKESEEDCSGGGDPIAISDALDFLSAETEFTSWAICLPRHVLAARNQFSWFLSTTFSASRRGHPSHTAVFPLPIPYEGVFEGSGPGLSKKRLKRIAHCRLVHLICVALNFLHGGRALSLELIRRPPGTLQLRCIRRLSNYVAACGSRSEAFPIAPGRGGPELISCMARLEAFLDGHPDLGDHYAWRGDGAHVPSSLPRGVSEKFPQLRPYRSLDSDRLRLKGTGEWPLEEYLEGPLWLPYVEPSFLLHGEPIGHCPVPILHREDKDEYWKLAMKWSEMGFFDFMRNPMSLAPTSGSSTLSSRRRPTG